MISSARERLARQKDTADGAKMGESCLTADLRCIPGTNAGGCVETTFENSRRRTQPVQSEKWSIAYPFEFL